MRKKILTLKEFDNLRFPQISSSCFISTWQIFHINKLVWTWAPFITEKASAINRITGSIVMPLINSMRKSTKFLQGFLQCSHDNDS